MQEKNDLQNKTLLTKENKIKTYYRNREQPILRLPNFYFTFRDTIFTLFSKKVPILKISFGYLLTMLFFIVSSALLIYRAKYVNWWASIFVGLTFLFTIKNSFLILLTGVLYETQVKIHKIIGLSAFAIAGRHGIYNLLYNHNIQLSIKISGLSMLIGLGCLILSGILFSYLNQYFTNFIYLHRICFYVVIIGAFFHNAYNIFYFGVFWVALDLVLRFVIMVRNCFLLKDMKAEVLDEKYVVLTFKKSDYFNFKEGQFVYLYSASLCLLQLHPFSITSSNNEGELKIMIKRFNNFTDLLYKKVKENKTPKIFVDGPYGGSMLDIWNKKMKHIMLISGGIGVTPMFSYLKFFLNRIKNGEDIKKVYFYWICRDTFLYNEIEQLISLTKGYESHFEFKLFLTENKEIKEDKENTENNLTDENFEKGRPVWKDEFHKVKAESIKNLVKKVGVFVCGPKGLKKEVVEMANDKSEGRISFDYNFEEFNPLFI